VVLDSDILKKAGSKAVILGGSAIMKTRELTQFIRESPILSGAAIGGTVIGGGLIVAQQIRKRKRKVAPKRKRISRRKAHIHRHVHVKRSRKHPRRVHKHRVKSGLDIIHKRKKRGISLKAIRASIASPRTPPQLKQGLRKLLRKRSR